MTRHCGDRAFVAVILIFATVAMWALTRDPRPAPTGRVVDYMGQ